MKYGISLLPDCRPETRSPTSYLDDVMRLSILGEELGIDYVKMTEHYLHPVGGYCPSPLAFLAAVGARTKRIRLMTGGIQASFHHPIQIAAQAAQVDVMTHGRLDVGFARAFLPYEFEAFNVDMNESKDRFRATIDAVIRLWTEKNLTLDTQYFSFAEATSYPEPAQRPHPPVWICAAMSEDSFRWAGERGFNLMMTSSPRPEQILHVGRLVNVYRSAFEEHHGDAERRPEVALSVPLMAGETDDEAMMIARPFLEHYIDVWRDAVRPLMEVDSPDYAGYREAGANIFDATVEQAAALTVMGSPDTIVRRIEEMREALTLDTILWILDLGSPDYRAMERNLRLFTEQVRPKVSD